jgi:hypothetical protein
MPSKVVIDKRKKRMTVTAITYERVMTRADELAGMGYRVTSRNGAQTFEAVVNALVDVFDDATWGTPPPDDALRAPEPTPAKRARKGRETKQRRETVRKAAILGQGIS